MPKLLQRIGRFLGELKRRRVVSAVLAYAIAAAGVMQVADVVAPRLHMPENTVNVVILLALVGLPLVAALAWVYDLVPDSRTRVAVSAPAAAAIALGAEPLALPAARPSTPRPVGRSVAVLPFTSLSSDPDHEYFADGITEDVISHLSKVGALRVIARTSVMPFRKREQSLRAIGEALGAAAVLEGSVRRAADRVRVVAQLVDVATEQYLWAETYDRQLTDVFAIQTDVALHIAAALQARLSADERSRIGKEPTHDLHAYQLYLQGRYSRVRYTAEGLHESIRSLRQAIRIDPGFAGAYASLAMAYEELAEIGALEPREAFLQAKQAVATALGLDPELAEAHSIAGQLKAICDYDWSGAEQDFKRALELSPSNADAWDLYGRLCSAQGRHDESVEMEKRAHELDPLAHRTDYATALLRAGRHQEGLVAAQRAVHLDPHYDRGRATLGWAYILTGRVAEGVAELEQAVALSPAATSWLAQLGQALARAGQTERAREVLQRLDDMARERYVSPYHFAYLLAGLGEYELAIDRLEQAYEERSGAVYAIKGSFLFGSLREHPRFAALLRRMNLS